MNKLSNFLSVLVHKCWVFYYMSKICVALMVRACRHDASKFSKYEEPYFRKYSTRLGKSVYGSKEYKGHMQTIKIALKHHYANNSHHPEFHDNGFDDMSLLDKIELLADWKSANKRHKKDDILNSLEVNQERFGYTDAEKERLKKTLKETKML